MFRYIIIIIYEVPTGNTVKLKRLGLAEDCNMADKVAEESKVSRFFQPFKNCLYRLRYLYRTWKLFVSCTISKAYLKLGT